MNNIIKRRGFLFSPVDFAFLAVFRVVVGVTFCFQFATYLSQSWVEDLYAEPEFHFKYFGFEWVTVAPDEWLEPLFQGLIIVSLAVAAGAAYRPGSLLLALGYSYIFLLDKSQYQNHYYLLMLTAWLLVLLPAGAAWSVDSLFRRAKRTTVPRWQLWLVRFQVGMPYFFGGVAKLNSDWMQGQPIRMKLASSTWYPVIGSFFTSEWCVQLFVWGGLLLDLLIVPFLLWQKTRTPAFLIALSFHLMNATLFNIGVFPWFMIFATLVFFEPGWARLRSISTRPGPVSDASLSRPKYAFVVAVAYVVVQIGLPWRHYFYPGNVSWTEEGHFFAWHMKLRDKKSVCRFRFHEPATGDTGDINILNHITPQQASHATGDPEMIVQLCRFLKEEMGRQGKTDCEIHALTITSLNGRKPQLLVNPKIDLAAVPRSPFLPRDVFVPLREPLRPFNPWSIPRPQWLAHVEIPNKSFWFETDTKAVVESQDNDNGVSVHPERAQSTAGGESISRLANHFTVNGGD